MESGFNNIADNILCHLPVAVYTTDENGLITYYNERAAQLWGYCPRLNDPSELRFCGSPYLYSSDGTLIPHDQCPMAHALRSKKRIRGEEISIGRSDGSRVPALVDINPVFAENGEFTGAINILFEISDYKRMEESAWRLAALVESSDDAIISKNLDGTITSWNKAAENMLGYSEHEVLGQNIRIIIPESRQGEEDIIINKIKKGERLTSFETIRLTKDGRLIPVSLTVSPIKNAKGEIIGASKIARDISIRIQIQQQLECYNEELKALNRFKDNFIAVASHELKTPLAIMKANLQFLELQLSSENEWKELVSISVEQTDRLNDIGSYFLDISKIQAGRYEFSFSVFNIHELIEECINYTHLLLKRHRIESHCKPSDPVAIFADRTKIGQVINNLLLYAIKYSPLQDRIIVKCCLEAQHLVICITNFGLGISDEQVKRIFNIFFKGEETSLYPGLGVELYLSQKIIKAHEGQISVESSQGQGSSFHIRLPLKEESLLHQGHTPNGTNTNYKQSA
jgi:PAS domain S-box-containing protein